MKRSIQRKNKFSLKSKKVNQKKSKKASQRRKKVKSKAQMKLKRKKHRSQKYRKMKITNLKVWRKHGPRLRSKRLKLTDFQQALNSSRKSLQSRTYAQFDAFVNHQHSNFNSRTEVKPSAWWRSTFVGLTFYALTITTLIHFFAKHFFLGNTRTHLQ